MSRIVDKWQSTCRVMLPVPVRDYAVFDALNRPLARVEKERNGFWNEWFKERAGLRPLRKRSLPLAVLTNSP